MYECARKCESVLHIYYTFPQKVCLWTQKSIGRRILHNTIENKLFELEKISD